MLSGEYFYRWGVILFKRGDIMKARYMFWVGVIGLVMPISAMSDSSLMQAKWQDLYHMVCITRTLVAHLEHHVPGVMSSVITLRRTHLLSDYTQDLVKVEHELMTILHEYELKMVRQKPVFAEAGKEQRLYEAYCRGCSVRIDTALTKFTDDCDAKILREVDIRTPFFSFAPAEHFWVKNCLYARGCPEENISHLGLSSLEMAILLSSIRKYYFIPEGDGVVRPDEVLLDITQ